MGPKAHGLTVDVADDLSVTLRLLGKSGGEVGSVTVSFDTFRDVLKDAIAQMDAIDAKRPLLHVVIK